jgi:hypothetical protein
LFYRLAQQAVAVEPAPLDAILHPEKNQARELPARKPLLQEDGAKFVTKQATGTQD